MAKLTKSKVKKAIPGTHGIVTNLADKCGVSRVHMSRYIHYDRNKDLLQLLKHERERLIDIAENKLFQEIEKGNTKVVKWFLSTQGKSRGYSKRQEIKHETDIKPVMSFEEEYKRFKELEEKNETK
ncbi:hypothetical protein GF327_05520 [Candidatus Woesearchaeota archaeon]|nr:hypothetical protein [Candidatus Woesearchaeota archaeon]